MSVKASHLASNPTVYQLVEANNQKNNKVLHYCNGLLLEGIKWTNVALPSTRSPVILGNVYLNTQDTSPQAAFENYTFESRSYLSGDNEFDMCIKKRKYPLSTEDHF